MYCSNCGSQVEEDQLYCPNCGINLANNNRKKEDKNSGKAIRGWGLGCLLTLLLHGIGLILCLILGDEDCRRGALSVFLIPIALVAIIGLIVALMQL